MRCRGCTSTALSANGCGECVSCRAGAYPTNRRRVRVELRIVPVVVHIHVVNSLSFSDARANLKAVMDRAVADRVPIAITRQRAEGVVVISQSE